jgi:hypothetical protein
LQSFCLICEAMQETDDGNVCVVGRRVVAGVIGRPALGDRVIDAAGKGK